jgi:PHD/YefM family antitoxin component YafN of YafNO toxin-antitoxin module
MDPLDSATRITLDEADSLGIPALVREVENGRAQVILRDGKPVAVMMSLEQFEQLRQDQTEGLASAGADAAPVTPAKTPGPFRPVDPATHPLLGKWRIVEMALWDRDYLDMEEPAYITFNERGGGEFVFGLVYGSLDCGYSPRSIDFTWVGNDEMDDASGDGWAELQDDGTVMGEIAFFQGDESEFKAQRW